MLAASNFSDVMWEVLRESNSNPDEVVRLLGTAPPDKIVLFHKEFLRAMQNLMRSGVYTILRSVTSDDALEDILSYIVGQGKEYYDKIIAHPELAPRHVNPDDAAFSGAASSVYWTRFREEIPSDLN